MKKLALFVAWGLASASAHAASVVAVLSGDAAPYKEALAGLKSAFPDAEAATLPEMPNMGGAKVIVTFGGEAALKKYPASAALVAALLPDPKMKPKHGGSVTRVGLLPDPGVLVAKIKALHPGSSSMAAFDVGGLYAEYLSGLKAAGASAGLVVNVKRVDAVTDLAGKLPAMKGSVQVLWIPPDPLIMNPQTFTLLTGFCSAAKIALIAPVAALAQAGAFAGISPSFNAVGKAAGKAAEAYISGGNPGALVYPSSVETVLNSATAAAIGVSGAGSKADKVVP